MRPRARCQLGEASAFNMKAEQWAIRFGYYLYLSSQTILAPLRKNILQRQGEGKSCLISLLDGL